MNSDPGDELRRRRREFIRAHHPDHGGDPGLFAAGLRALDADPEPDADLEPRVTVVRRRAWMIRRLSAMARRLRDGPEPPRVR